MRFMLLGLLFLGVSAPAQAVWKEANTRHFRIYSEGSEKVLSDFAKKVERFDTFLRTRFNLSDVDTPQRLTIFMLPSADAVAKSFDAGREGRSVAGYYTPRDTGSIAVVHRESSSSKAALDADAVLFHEYAHHFMLSNFPVAYPAWYVEGFAEFFATVDFTTDGRAKTGLPPYYRGYGLLTGPEIKAEKLLSVQGSELKFEERDVFYGRSWLLVHYLQGVAGRQGQLLTYLREINAGKSSLDAARSAFGDLQILDKELDKYVGTRLIYSTQIKPTPAPTELSVVTLSDALSDLVPIRLKSMHGIRDDKAAALVNELRAYTAKYPAQAEGWYWLAKAHESAKQAGEAAVAVEAALKIDPGFSRALLLKADMAVKALMERKTTTPADWKAARALIVKANRANVNDPMPLLRYYESWVAEQGKPNAVANDGIRRAFEMVPEATNVRMVYAFSLANAKRYDEAIKLVEPVAFAPHESGDSASARAILARLKDAKAGKTDEFDSATLAE